MEHRFRLRSSPFFPFLILLLNLSLVSADFTQAYCSTQNTANTSPFFWTWQSNGKCADYCNGQGTYAFAVIQFTNCWCSNYVPAQQSDMSGCQVNCPGFPSNKCGDQSKGLYIYIDLGAVPSGTQGSSPSVSSAASVPSSSGASSSSSTQATTPPAPVSQIVTTIITPSPKTVFRTVTTVVPATTPKVFSTFTFISTSSSSIPTLSTSSKSSTTLKTMTSNLSSMTSVWVVTESGAIVTKTLLVAPTEAPATMTGTTSSGSKTGAIAGGVVGGLLGLAAIVGAVFFALWRRRKQQRTEQYDDQAGGSSGITRNASTMSKAGLIVGASEKEMQAPPKIVTTFAPHVTRHDLDQISPVRASDHRYSQPVMIDSRLDPRAVLTFHGSNVSRESLASMDDSRDYGRQLNVRNPDLPNRP